MKKHVVTAAKYGLGLGLLAYVLYTNWGPSKGSPGLAEAFRQPVQTGPLVIASVLCLASVLLTFVRWYVLVRAQGLPFTLPNAMRLGLIGYALSTFLPGSIGGDIIKAVAIAREQSRRTVAVATVLIDRAVGLWGLVWLVAILGLIFQWSGMIEGESRWKLDVIIYGAVAIVFGSMVVWFLLGFLPQRRADKFAGRLEKIPKVGHSCAEFWRAVWMYRLRGKSVFLALVLALVGHVGFVLTFYFAARTLQPAQDIPTVQEHFLIVPIGMAVQAVFPAPGGVGGGEYGYGKLYELIHYPEANGVLGSLVQRVITWGLGLIGYLVYLRMKPALRRAQSPATVENADADRELINT